MPQLANLGKNVDYSTAHSGVLIVSKPMDSSEIFKFAQKFFSTKPNTVFRRELGREGLRQKHGKGGKYKRKKSKKIKEKKIPHPPVYICPH